MLWSYGVTTVPQRRGRALPETLASLAAGGFPEPRLFVDGGGEEEYRGLGLPVTARQPAVRTAANWTLALAELYIRQPKADYVALFQDDVAVCSNLRVYLELTLESAAVRLGPCYWNLYTVPENQAMAPRGRDRGSIPGWFKSNQLGKGALALVFTVPAVQDLLRSERTVTRPTDFLRGQSNVDGLAVCAMKDSGRCELVHNPSLVQHTGHSTTMAWAPLHRVGRAAVSFQGEGWDPCTLLSGS